ncbi:MAG: hypothetical protein JWQ89_1831 [Devosia sp.]|uniref:hypothetical protein n=1 Tax=Devosia sp. TaxID=1871048 RepID=UPI00261DBBBB|nr:hypothetical protein [Devosia sp.]MDB5540104.1 hypothetical protein [Devosia sp.]
MARAHNRPILVRRINLWWYAAAIVPILALGWLAASGIVPAMFVPIVLFVLIFWLASFIFAVVGKLRGPRPDPRQ